MQLHQPAFLNELAALDARLLVLSFADVNQLRNWVPYFQRHFLEPASAHLDVAAHRTDPFERTRFLADRTRGVYHAYGLGRNSAWRVYGPQILWQYAKWWAQGNLILIQDDALQRGGDFVVDRDGRLKLAHTGRDQSDRPSADAILTALRHS